MSSDGRTDEQYLEQRLGPRPTLDTQLTTWEAADIAGVSRPYVLQLLDAGAIPYEQDGRHRRILCRDLIAYLRADDVRREEAADELSRLGQEFDDQPIHVTDAGGYCRAKTVPRPQSSAARLGLAGGAAQ